MANNNLYKRFASYFLLCIAVVLLLSGCAQDEVSDPEDNQKVLVPVEISGINLVQTKALGDPTYTIDRILILPFKKIDESISANDDYNFAPDYASAVQYDVNSFAYSTMLSLPKSVTYKIMVIGYGRNDFDLLSPGSNTGRFKIDPLGASATLSTITLYSTSFHNVPEIFTATGTAYNDATSVGQSFKAEQINKLSANLTRLVSGISLSINNVPSFVKSISLASDYMTVSVKLKDRQVWAWTRSLGGTNMLLDTQAPVAGKVTISKYLMPIYQANPAKLYLTITYADNTMKEYPVKVSDVPGLSSANNITFASNNMVFISGDYLNMDIGFQIQYAINLDDDIWDGITTN
jgi:hypothetical protein